MKPTEILTDRLSADVVPLLSKQYGFRFARSSRAFSRKKGPFKQSFHFSISRHSASNLCIFWTMWSVSSRTFSQWHEATWGEKPANDSVAGCADWNISGWTPSAGEDHLTLTNADSDNAVIAELLGNIEKRGIPFLDRFSSWERAAEQLVSKNWMYDRAADFYLIADNLPSAKATLLKGIQTFEVDGRKDQFRQLPRLKKRLGKLSAIWPSTASKDEQA